MSLFIFFNISLLIAVWAIFIIVTRVAISTNHLINGSIALEAGVVNRIAANIQNIGSFLGLPLNVVADVNNRTAAEFAVLAADIMTGVRRYLLIFAGISSLIILLLITAVGRQSDGLMGFILVNSIVLSFFVMAGWDPIILTIAPHKRIRRSVRPLSLILIYCGVMSGFWLNFSGQAFFHTGLYLLTLYTLAIMAWGFRAYYLFKTTNTAGRVLNATFSVLMIILVLKTGAPRIFYSALDWASTTYGSLTDQVVNNNLDRRLNLYQVDAVRPYYILKGKKLHPAGRTTKGQILSRLNGREMVIGSETFVLVNLANREGLYLIGPYWVPLKWLKTYQEPEQQIARQLGAGEEFLVITGSQKLPSGYEYEVISMDGDVSYTFDLTKNPDRYAEPEVGEVIPATSRPLYVLVDKGDYITLIKRSKRS